MPFLIFPILWIALVLGRRVCRTVLGDIASPIELSAVGAATGLGIVAYAVLALGLAAQLRQVPVAVLFALLALAGGREHATAVCDTVTALRRARPTPRGVLLGIVLAFFAVVALFGCLTPPTPLEWDSLSYHLADPKIYLHYGRILYLPWESHSNFAFTMEMLYTLGLMLHSTAAAKAFHLAMAVLAVLSVYLIGSRHVSPRTGKLGALIFASVPLVFWEAGTAYVDLAATAFGGLAILALLNGAASPKNRRWLWISAVMLGFMFGVKATSAITIVLVCAWIFLAVDHEDGVYDALRTALIVGLVAAAIGSPWYIKSAVYTGTPVYPFANNIFGGKYWAPAESANYNKSQQQFGVGHTGPSDKRLPKLAELMLTPWDLTQYSEPSHIPPDGSKLNPFNDFPSPYVALTPLFLAMLFVPAFVGRALNVTVRRLAIFSFAFFVIWFFLTQQVRYMLPILVPLSVITAACIEALWTTTRFCRYAAAALVCVSLLASLATGWQRIMTTATVVTGRVSAEDYLSHRFTSYGAMQYLNQLPPNTRVVFYGEPLGYYCNQPYMWGEIGHSALIPYDKLGAVDNLRAYFDSRNIHYVLWNTVNFPPGSGPHWADMVRGLLTGPNAQPIYINDQRTVVVFRVD